MLYDIALDPITGDIALPIVNLRPAVIIFSGVDKVRQQIYLTLCTFLGEWFLDTTFGVPWLQDILIKGPSGSKIRSILRAAVLAVPDVTQVTTLDLVINKQTRQMAVRLVAVTNDGKVALAAPLTSLPVAQWGVTRWGQSVWGPGSGANTASGVWDSSKWDSASWGT